MPTTPPPEPERRGNPRHPTLQRCFVWPPDAQPGAPGWACIAYNVSSGGMG
jgi:hypothetical protein